MNKSLKGVLFRADVSPPYGKVGLGNTSLECISLSFKHNLGYGKRQ